MRVLLVGTGTEIGKTHATCALLAAARQDRRPNRRPVVAYKPIATGIEADHEGCEDAARHAAALGAPYLAPTFAYRRPISPHLAAREEGRPIELAQICARADELGGRATLVIEGAGGLCSPLGETTTNLDLARALAPAQVVLVAPDRLGVLHDVGACVLAAGARGVAIAAVVLSAPATPDASTGSNGDELRRLGVAIVAGVLPRAAYDAPESLAVARAIWAALDRP
jgi:dethiobiotin synthetase